MTDQLEQVVVNLAPAGVRYAQMEGREYMVLPVVMMKEGVLNGSDGPLFYPATELSNWAMTWNHRPVVVYHPERNGRPVSAAFDPEMITARKVGVVMNVRWDDATRRLLGEAWLEEDRVKAVDARVLEMIQNGGPIEISTGLFPEKDETAGEFEGKFYHAIARNLRSDHLAILPDRIGACSIEDGCGMVRNMADESYQQLSPEIRELYEKQDGGWWSLKAATALVGNHRREGNNMPDVDPKVQKLVDDLVANDSLPWCEEDREFLTGQTECRLKEWLLVGNEMNETAEKLKRAEEVAAAAREGAREVNPPVSPAGNQEGAGNSGGDTTHTPMAADLSPEDYLAKADMPPEVKALLANSLATQRSARESLVKEISANENNHLTAEDLTGMEMPQLQRYAETLRAFKPPAPPTFNYAGNAAPDGREPVDNAGNYEPLVAPSTYPDEG